MSNQKIVYYSLENIEKEDAIINIIFGERSNGKSYQLKHKKAVENYLNSPENNRERFMLVRRMKEDIKPEKIEQYFNDVDIYKLTDGKYNCITLFKGKLWLSNYNPESRPTIKRGDYIGYVVALSTEQTYAGASYLDVTNIIFEEYQARGGRFSSSGYLSDEPSKLMNLYSTVDRKRGTTKLWMVGNTISRVCPYYDDWNIKNIIIHQHIGTIEIAYIPTGSYDEEGNPETIKIAMEYCKATGRSSHVIGKHAQMMNEGAWQSDPQPHLPKSYNDYNVRFRCIFMYQEFKFIGEFLQDPITYDYCWYIYPYKGEISDDMLVFTDVIKPNRRYMRDIYNVDTTNDYLKRILSMFTEGNIFYASDMCGTEFKQCIDFVIRR